MIVRLEDAGKEKMAVEFEAPQSDLSVEEIDFRKKKRSKMKSGEAVGKGVMVRGTWHGR
ncbi:MAG: hypothetical protein OHK005_13000 [Candidatus Methylacidiphilales bacterium]